MKNLLFLRFLRCLTALTAWCLVATSAKGAETFGYKSATVPPNFVNLVAGAPGVSEAGELVGDDTVQRISLGFPFFFYDNEYTTCFPSTNGLIAFGASGSSSYAPHAIPSSDSVPHNFIAPFWTDLIKNTTTSKVLYSTQGSAPSRIFIIQWQDFEELGTPANKITFQVHLYEGSNAIEMQYKASTGTFGSAVSSRYLGIGIENSTGTSGVQIRYGLLSANYANPPNTRFTRPVSVTVESQYIKPDNTTDTIGALTTMNPKPTTVGTPLKVAYQSVQRFEAPEFIYLTQTFKVATDLSPTAKDEDLAVYRLRNLGYAIDGEAVQGVDRFFERTITRDIKVIWRWELEYAVFVESNVNAGIGDADPKVGRTWVAKDTQFSASIARTVGESLLDPGSSGSRYAADTYQLTRGGGSSSPAVKVATAGNRVVTENVTIADWLRVRWTMTSEVRYLFDAADNSGGNLSGESFVRVVAKAGDPNSFDSTIFGNASRNEIWIPVGRKVEVGSFYRTSDRCFTLGNFSSTPTGDLEGIGRDISVLSDTTLNGNGSRVARVWTVDSAKAPSEIHFLYEPTVFRAEIPLGSSLDSVVPQLVPPICDGAVLSDAGPGAAINPVGPLATGRMNGLPLRWDQVSKRLFPVHPGSYQITWPDQTRRKSYKIEVVSGYPGSVVPLNTAKEEDTNGKRQFKDANKNGTKEDSEPYVFETALKTIEEYAPDSDFPAQYRREVPTSPTLAHDAHYHHIFDPDAGRRPPTKLDLSATDEWKFHELTYTDPGTEAIASPETAGAPFSSKGAGRSVLLFSVRPNPDEVADDNLTKQKLVVRVIRSEPVAPILPDNEKFVLGRRGLELGGGATGNQGAFGVIQTGEASTVDPGTNFVMDFWLNAKGLQDIAVALTNCTTTKDTTNVTCASTAGLLPGMSITGTNIAAGTTIAKITNQTTFDLSAPATGNDSLLTLTASDKPVTVVSTGGDKFKVVLDAVDSTVTATYRGISVTHPFSKAGAAWRHYVVHVFTSRFFGIDLTIIDFYADGVRAEQGMVTALMPTGTASSTVGATLGENSLRFGLGANPNDGLQLDQFRLFGNLDAGTNSYLTPSELRRLRTQRSLSLRSIEPQLHFSLEKEPANGLFPNNGSMANVGLGPVVADTTEVFAGTWARLDIQEVATRIDSTLDNAGFGGSGYILNSVSNYNANLYTRGAEIGAWGPIFPVNDQQLYTDTANRLEVAYYENPFLQTPADHPNVAWPYEVAAYNEVKYPEFGPHKNKAIYIASRIGSEGVDVKGRPQEVFDLAKFSDLKIYNQPSTTLPGYNPNEEHALVAPSGRAGLKIKNLGEDIPNNPPLAAFALQADINAGISPYSSDPWVLVQVNDLVSGEPEMAAYQVFKTRLGEIFFPRPPDDGLVAGLAYESAAAAEDRFLTIDPSKTYPFTYAFSFPAAAGDLLIPPYPLNLVIGNVSMPDATGGNDTAQRTLWKDVNKNPWVVSGDGTFFYQYFYPFRNDFYLPSTTIGTPVAWLPDEQNGSRKFTSNAADKAADTAAGKVVYTSFWRNSYPKLKRGETLTYQGGEFFNENPGSNGLPALVAMKAAEIVFDSSTKDMILNDSNLNSYSARIVRVLDRHEAQFTVAQMKEAGFSPAATSVFVVAERWYFKDLPGSLQKRFYFDSLAQNLVFRGRLNDKESGDSDLTSGPDPLNILEPNVMTVDELNRIKAIAPKNEKWITNVTEIYNKSWNPMLIRPFTPPHYPVVTDKNLAGMKESPVATQKIGVNTARFNQVAESEDEKADLAAKLAAEKLRIKTLSEEIIALEGKRSKVRKRTDKYKQYNGQITAKQKEINSIDTKAIEKSIEALGTEITFLNSSYEKDLVYNHLDSFGVGAALVPNPALLMSATTDGSRYLTIVENNRSELSGAPISLHIIEIIPDRYRGAIKVIEAADAFSEKVTLQHNGEFGANTDDLYYEWWIRDAGPLDVVADEVLSNGTLMETDSRGQSLWQQYVPEPKVAKTPAELEALGVTAEEAKHLGLHSIVFEGRPDVVLADKLVLMRYRHKTESSWRLVPFEFTNPNLAWKPGTSKPASVPPSDPAPFQWAGAANSPQLQADGSKRYIPQLVMGWVKRVLDRINPYEARYTDFFSNESPATYSSQVQIAGGPFAGKVALNPDKNVIEKTGLIELYETVLARARELSIDNSSNPVSTDGINQALLLAATRLSVLYELLAREAYSDAQDSTITANDGTLAGAASYTHAFQNMEADLMHEELALLRGTDFRKSYPVYNRMFWNYAKGLGEAAYNVNYNIYDANTDGFINEDDARILYPQGHGDSWGHATSAVNMHYTLLQHPGFNWRTRSELYSLMQNVLEVDFLDEKTFARLASSKARAGRDIVRATYRLNYTQDPDGQWQGYTDGADPARAWGVSEWAHRAGQGAYFDWAVANALLPEDAGAATPVKSPENLDRIERSGAVDDIGEIAGGLHEIQNAMDEANGGVNPLGFDADALTFDIDQQFYDNSSGGDRRSHFEQVLIRAKESAAAALATLEFATQSGNKLRALSDDTDGLIQETMRQDLDFRNRLIEIFGRPYTGTIGFGKAYPEGYEGPDTLLFSYLDKLKLDQIVPKSSTVQNDPLGTITFDEMQIILTGTLSNGKRSGGLSNQTGDEALFKLYKDVWGEKTAPGKRNEAFTALMGDSVYFLEDQVNTISLPFNATAKYGFQALPDWGQRTSYGKLQTSLHDMLSAEAELDTAVADYIGFLQDYQNKTKRLVSDLELFSQIESLRDEIGRVRKGVNGTFVTIETVIGSLEIAARFVTKLANTIDSASPHAVGLSNDLGAIPAGIARAADIAASTPLEVTKGVKEIAKRIAEMARDEAIADLDRDILRVEKVSEIEGKVEELTNLSGGDQPKRNAIAMASQALEGHRQAYFTAQAEGFRLLREREAFNKTLASKVQKNRYQDMIFRLSRNEAMSKYQSAFNNTARYTWLAARAYDYETSLDEGHPAAPGALLDRIIRERQLGLWADGEPQSGQGGLAEILSQLSGNFAVLKSPLGILNPQPETEKISLRHELFRIGEVGVPASDDRWKDAIKARIVPDLNSMPEFIRHCRPFANPAAGPQPGIVIRFPTVIESGKNFFGLQLAAGDHAYSAANFATKIQSFGVWLENYNAAGLSTSPRAYLLPVGNDYLRTSTSALPVTRAFNVVEQRIPVPFVINASNLTNPGYIPTLNGVDGNFGELRRHGDFRMYHDNGEPEPDDSETISSNRLVARSVWNSEWLLIIPGSSLRALDPTDRDSGLKAFADHVQDIKLYFLTYSHQGQ